jgi:hypothetical protein
VYRVCLLLVFLFYAYALSASAAVAAAAAAFAQVAGDCVLDLVYPGCLLLGFLSYSSTSARICLLLLLPLQLPPLIAFQVAGDHVIWCNPAGLLLVFLFYAYALSAAAAYAGCWRQWAGLGVPRLPAAGLPVIQGRTDREAH